MEPLTDREILVVGLARSGLAVATFLRNRGARVTITDCRPPDQLAPAAAAARQLGCTLALGGHPPELFTAAERIIVSPGVPLDLPPLAAAREQGIPVIGELEFAWRHLQLPVAAISGTNGKTTTTALLGDMLRRSGRRVFVGGNIGRPLIDIFLQKQAPELAVVEVSSFQLDATENFHPQLAVLLNITEDHLDRYDSFSRYVESKCRLFANQTEQDTAVLPARDPQVSSCHPLRARRLLFNRADPSAHARLRGSQVFCRAGSGPGQRYELGCWRLPGRHNLENLLAAVLAASSLGTSPQAIQESIDSFQPLPHRLELVHQWRGIRFYNDSKATNVASVVRSLESFTNPIVLIAGGRDKGGSYGPLTTPVRQRVKMLVLLGEARFRLARTLGHLTCTVVVDNLESAVSLALAAATPGDVVLLSPGCSSFDLYQDYQERGEHFRSLVQKLTAGQCPGTEGQAAAWSVSSGNG